MNKRILTVGAIVVTVVAAIAWLGRRDEPAVPLITATQETPAAVDQGSAPEQLPTDVPPLHSQPSPAAPADAFADGDYSEDPAKMFRANSQGDLVLNERTRLNIEKHSSLYTPQEQQQRLAVIEATLPASAYAQLVDLMQRYENFTQAVKQAYAPDTAPATVEDVAAQLEGVHALRVAHFGEEAAEAMYGKEERISRQLLEFMALEKHEGMTLDEKAERAQQMLLASPELAAAYESNRATPEN